jgi:ATP/maltotriose-dependent transcriptional regulator MalT
MLGHIELAARNVDAARDQFARSLERFRARAVPWGTGHALSGMAWVALASGDADQAERLLDEAALVLRDAGPWFGSLNIQRRANLAVQRGNPDQALRLVRESLTRIRELHDKFAFVYALIPLAAAAVLKGDDAWAARILGARDAVTERTGVTVVDEAVHDFREQTERNLRERLGPDRWARAYAAGRRISIDGLLQDIDRVVDGDPRPVR